jgi:hypothetical protein
MSTSGPINKVTKISQDRKQLMQDYTRNGNVAGVTALIEEGVRERPINLLFYSAHPSHFMGADLTEIDKFKTLLQDKISGKNYQLRRDLENLFQITELFLTNPTEDLEFKLDNDKDFLHHSQHFLPFFAWAAINNRADLLANPYFLKLFMDEPLSANESLVLATAFGSRKFLQQAFQSKSIDDKTINKCFSMAAATGDCETLALLIDITKKLNHEDETPEKGIETRKISGSYIHESTKNPLFWAVRNEHTDATELLLKSGTNPNEITDNFMKETCIKLAARLGNINIMQILLSYGADINFKSGLGKTALHDAASRDNLEVIKFLIENDADISIADHKGKTPLDCIKDESVKAQIQKFIGTTSPEVYANNTNPDPEGMDIDLNIGQVESTRGNSMKILIIGLHKADVLLNLYNNALCNGEVFDEHPHKNVLQIQAAMAGDGSREIAGQIIEDCHETNSYKFDYVDLGAGKRKLGVDLSGFDINPQEYDRNHGKGQAKRVINGMRNQMVAAADDLEQGGENPGAFLGFLKMLNEHMFAEERNDNGAGPSSTTPKPTKP